MAERTENGELYERLRKPQFFFKRNSEDGDHWKRFALSTVITLVCNLMLLAYFSGIIMERLDDVRFRVNRLETQVDRLQR